MPTPFTPRLDGQAGITCECVLIAATGHYKQSCPCHVNARLLIKLFLRPSLQNGEDGESSGRRKEVASAGASGTLW